MSKQSLLLVDGDTRSLRVLEVSLRKAGFTVTPASSVQDALDKLEVHTPDLIISETKFPTDLDGFELRRRVREIPDWSSIPFVFLTAETAIANKIRGLELGVDDYLTKPIYIKEIVTRINILLQKKQRTSFEDRKDNMRFAGRVSDMPVVDVIQTIEVSRKSGVIQFIGERHHQAAIYFRDGKVIDAEAGTLQGEDAVYRLLTWSEGEFEVVFRTVRRREAIATSSQGLLMEGMRRLDEWSRLLEQLPPLTHRFEVDANELSSRLGEVPDDNNRILRLIDGKRSLFEVIDGSDFGDLECLQAISRLFFEGLLHDLDSDQQPRREAGRSLPFEVSDSKPTPIEESASGPIRLADLIARAELVEPVPDEIREQDVFSEEASQQPGPLLGGYRPSSLRLIDEAVAAAQAIEPSLFEEDDARPARPDPTPALARVKLAMRPLDPRVEMARRMIEVVPPGRDESTAEATAAKPVFELEEPRRTNGDARVPEAIVTRTKGKSIPPPIPATELTLSDPAIEIQPDVPEVIEADEPPDIIDDALDQPTHPSLSRVGARREVSSRLRMIGSLGRDRAEASGELGPQRTTAPLVVDPQRELVTIMPRRNTRELAVIGESEPSTPTPDQPRELTIEDFEVPRRRGPGVWVIIAAVAGALLVSWVAYLLVHNRVTRSPRKDIVQPAQIDAGVVDAWSEAIVRNPVIADASVPADARVVRISKDAAVAVVAVAPPDAGALADAGVDRTREARDLLEKAHAALEDGDPDKALALADASLKMRKTARTYLERARALQRLDRIDDALKSVDGAMELVHDYAPAWEQRGLILWAARRHDEAKQAFTKYIALDPTGKSAPLFHRLLDEPK